MGVLMQEAHADRPLGRFERDDAAAGRAVEQDVDLVGLEAERIAAASLCGQQAESSRHP
ncbi:hypothetical protein WME99_33470 [Sorangium sp. So ce136]|uniref:hypothetical protein n=1 Tax=Sorangium sp. So ce136 TaxID=3133284 RepID=UPI003F0D956E